MYRRTAQKFVNSCRASVRRAAVYTPAGFYAATGHVSTGRKTPVRPPAGGINGGTTAVFTSDDILKPLVKGYLSSCRASRCQRECREFESLRPLSFVTRVFWQRRGRSDGGSRNKVPWTDADSNGLTRLPSGRINGWTPPEDESNSATTFWARFSMKLSLSLPHYFQ